jgi:hypothetical protein
MKNQGRQDRENGIKGATFLQQAGTVSYIEISVANWQKFFGCKTQKWPLKILEAGKIRG